MHAHKKGQGCASCASNNGGVSFKALTWLDHIAETEKINIIHAGNGGEYKLPHSNYRADGFCKETNTVYEFHGDLFHGNINRFDPNAVLNPFRPGMTIQELYDRTLKREEGAVHILRMPEKDSSGKVPNGRYIAGSDVLI